LVVSGWTQTGLPRHRGVSLTRPERTRRAGSATGASTLPFRAEDFGQSARSWVSARASGSRYSCKSACLRRTSAPKNGLCRATCSRISGCFDPEPALRKLIVLCGAGRFVVLAVTT
jgi:hypothetical protein